MTKNRMVIGESDYESLIKDGFYYIDKTLLIKEVLDNTSRVALITRLRRIGKTLNMTMMRYFFIQKNYLKIKNNARRRI